MKYSFVVAVVLITLFLFISHRFRHAKEKMTVFLGSNSQSGSTLE